TKAAEARPVFERLSEHHIGKIIPSGKQERLEHRQRRPGLLAFGRSIDRCQSPVCRCPIKQGVKLVEARLPSNPCIQPQSFLPYPPMCHDPLQIRVSKGNHGQQAPESTSKHLRTGLVSRETRP